MSEREAPADIGFGEISIDGVLARDLEPWKSRVRPGCVNGERSHQAPAEADTRPAETTPRGPGKISPGHLSLSPRDRQQATFGPKFASLPRHCQHDPAPCSPIDEAVPFGLAATIAMPGIVGLYTQVAQRLGIAPIIERYASAPRAGVRE